MRGGRQETNKYIFQIILSIFLKKDMEEDTISGSCCIRSWSDVSGNLLGGFWRSCLMKGLL